jgi:uncharacterized protein YkwD
LQIIILFFTIGVFSQTSGNEPSIIDAYSVDISPNTNRVESCSCRSTYVYFQFEIDILNLINSHRQSIGLLTLTLTNHTSNNCLDHTNYMISTNTVNHNNFVSRSGNIQCALNASRVGENVAYNFKTPESVVNAWLASTSHRENIENPEYTSFGISVRINSLDKAFITNIFTKQPITSCSSIPTIIPYACDNDITITANVTTGLSSKQAVNSIEALNTISSGASAIYHAGTSVVFKPSFNAKSGATFHAYIAGCTGTFNARQSSSTKNKENDIEADEIKEIGEFIKIYPNPNNGNFRIGLNNLSEGRIQIFDLVGQIVYKSIFKDQKELEVNLQNKPQGVYVLKVYSKDGVYTEKIIKN